MKNLKFKKIRIAKINNLSKILGGNNEPSSYYQQTVKDNCLPDTFTCPPKYTEDPNYTTCQITNGGTRTLGNGTTGFDNSGG